MPKKAEHSEQTNKASWVDFADSLTWADYEARVPAERVGEGGAIQGGPVMGRENKRPATMQAISVGADAPPPAPVAPLMPSPGASGYPQSSLLHAFRRCWMLATTLGLVAGGLVGTLWWFSIPEQFSAEIRVRVPLPWTGAAGEAANEDEIARHQRTQAALIQSANVLEGVLNKPDVARLAAIQQEHDALAWLGNHLVVSPTSIPDVLLLRINDTSSEEAVLLVRTIADVYRETVANQRQSSAQQLKEARARTEESMRQKRQKLSQLENSRLGTAQRECQQARFDLRVARAELADLEQRRPRVEQVAVTEQALLAYLKEDTIGRRRLQEVEEAHEQIKQLIRVSALKEKDPQLPLYSRQLDEAVKRMEMRREEVRPLVEQQQRQRALELYQAQINARRERVAFYEGLVKTLEDEVQHLGGGAAAEEMKTLREEMASGSESLRKIVADQERLESSLPPSEVRQAGEIVAVQRKSPKGRLQPAILGGVGCCALLMFAVSWREQRLRRITSGSDIAAGLYLPVLGNVPLKRTKDGLSPELLEEGGRLSDAVDALRTVLLHDGNKTRLLLVTSAIAGEGKTSLAALLASSLARAWRKTLFVDADLRKPEAQKLFETQLEPGLSELLRGEAELGDVIQTTPLSRLWMISAGHCDAHAIQALAQEGVGQLFASLKQQFDFVIIDAGPILPVADTLLLSTHVDSVLLAVRSGVSRLPVVQAAKQRLHAVNTSLRGAVLMGPDSDFHGKVIARAS